MIEWITEKVIVGWKADPKVTADQLQGIVMKEEAEVEPEEVVK